MSQSLDNNCVVFFLGLFLNANLTSLCLIFRVYLTSGDCLAHSFYCHVYGRRMQAYEKPPLLPTYTQISPAHFHGPLPISLVQLGALSRSELPICRTLWLLLAGITQMLMTWDSLRQTLVIFFYIDAGLYSLTFWMTVVLLVTRNTVQHNTVVLLITWNTVQHNTAV
jgi:hypothetical protein